MKKMLVFLIFSVFFSISCDDLLYNEGSPEVKKLRVQNAQLRKQVQMLSAELGKIKDDIIVKDMIISLYNLRHAMEKYASDNKGKYPVADDISQLRTVLSDYLPKDFQIEIIYLEKVKSNEKGYLIIANVKNQKVFVSNL